MKTLTIALTTLLASTQASAITATYPTGTAPIQVMKTLPDGKSHGFFAYDKVKEATKPMQYTLINGVEYFVVKYTTLPGYSLIRTDDLSVYKVNIPNQETSSCIFNHSKPLEALSWVRVGTTTSYVLQSVNCSSPTWKSPTRLVIGNKSYRISKQYKNGTPLYYGAYLADDEDLLVPNKGLLTILK